MASITLVPDPAPSATSIFTVPSLRICSRRSVRKTTQPFKPALVALAPARHAIAHPVFLGGDAALQLVALHLFLFQHVVTPGLERGEAFLQSVGLATIQPDGSAGEIFQEPPVMADQASARAMPH